MLLVIIRLFLRVDVLGTGGMVGIGDLYFVDSSRGIPSRTRSEASSGLSCLSLLSIVWSCLVLMWLVHCSTQRVIPRADQLAVTMEMAPFVSTAMTSADTRETRRTRERGDVHGS